MDLQRARRLFGKSDCFIVIPIDESQLDLRPLWEDLKGQYRGIERCLPSPGKLHLTLLGAHNLTGQWLETVAAALDTFNPEFSPKTIGLSGLGSWRTEGAGKVVLFLELENAEEVKILVRDLSRHLLAALQADEEGYFGADAERRAAGWMDVVDDDNYQPHVTLMLLDPDMDADVIAQMEAKSGADPDKKTNKKKKKQSSREKAQVAGRREKVLQEMEERESNFGRAANLFRKERKRFRKWDFGRVAVSAIHVESGFTVKHRHVIHE